MTTNTPARRRMALTAAAAVAVAALGAACTDDGAAQRSRPPAVQGTERPPAGQTDERGTDDPFVLRGATVMRTPTTSVREDLYVADGVLVEPTRDEHTVVDASGTYAVPLTVESAVSRRPVSQRNIHDLVPGNRATFALVRRPVGEVQVRTMLVIDPADLAAVYVSGHLEALDGRPTRPAGADLTDPAAAQTWVGTWVDPARDVEQHLLADGRYSETRSGRADAYTGRYWVRDDRITYLDDSGFWAFGELLDGTLHHAGLVMDRPDLSLGSAEPG
ncbi:Atu4866 domain-containing protein [Promicromonospora sp. NPDC052451]|uniref:Atu4866 domain-containing protein n=1 Tax=unclassified Promicromonospora TaxID=2647929 RepID=UPI0037CC77CC